MSRLETIKANIAVSTTFLAPIGVLDHEVSNSLFGSTEEAHVRCDAREWKPVRQIALLRLWLTGVPGDTLGDAAVH